MTPFAQSLQSNFDEALRLLSAAITDCPAELWVVDLWADQEPTAPAPDGGLMGSAPWFLAYHALTILDYDLSAEFEPWKPPAPFDDNTWSLPNRVFTPSETLAYVDHCRDKVGRVLAALDEEAAARLVPETHRYGGRPYGTLVGSLPLHTVEHATQIRQFLTAAGVTVQPMPGDRHYRG